jgi:Domain of unknown function (DUF4340)
MKFRGLILAVVVLAALTGFLYWSNHHPVPDDSTKSSADTPPKILSLNEPDIVRLEIKDRGQDAVVVTRDGSDKWQITEPKAYGADQETARSLASAASSVNSDRLIEDKATNLKQYGLDPPLVEVTVAEKDNKTQHILIGDDTPTGNDVYAALVGDPRVFMMASYVKNSLDKGLKDLRDKRLLTLDSDKITTVELLANKQDLVFGRSKDAWQFLKPTKLRADSSKVDDLIRKLTDAKMDLSLTDADAKKSASAFASGAPVATVKMTGDAGSQELQVRKSKDDYYAKSSAVEGVFKLTADLGQSLTKGIDDYRNSKLFDFGFADPNSIEIHDGAKSYSLTKSGSDWWSNGTKMDSSTVDTLVEQLRGLSAAKFVDSGFASPAINLTVISNDGKLIEKIQIAKSGDNYIAKRENEFTLYQLTSDAIDQLRKSADGVKPLPPAPAKK